MNDLAIMAGRGVLPAEVSAAIPDALVVSFSAVGIDFEPQNHLQTEFEKLGSLFNTLKKQGITRICFVGAMSRPELSMAKLDLKTTMMLPKIKAAMSASDGNTLRMIRTIFEGEGFFVVGAHVLLPQLVADIGQMGAHAPKITEYETKALARAVNIHTAMSELDIGQGLVMRRGQCIAMETLPGTAAMLDFVATHAPIPKPSGFLFKSSKTNQDLDMDMASIGPHTIDQLVAAGLSGAYLRAGQVLILDRADTIRRADAAGVFITGIE